MHLNVFKKANIIVNTESILRISENILDIYIFLFSRSHIFNSVQRTVLQTYLCQSTGKCLSCVFFIYILVIYKYASISFDMDSYNRYLICSIQFPSSSAPAHGEKYWIKHYVIKFVSDLRQVCGFLWLLRFPPPIKLTAKI